MTTMSEVLTYVHTKLTDDKFTLGLEDVWLGDQTKLPRTPSVAVEPGESRRELNGAPRRTENTFILYLMIYHNKLQDSQVTRLEAQQFSEVVESFIHADPRLGGLVIHSLVTANESGYANRENTLLVTNRLTLEARDQTQLPGATP